MTLHFLNDVNNNIESIQNPKLRHNRLFEEHSTMGKLLNRIPVSHLLISNLPGSALRSMLNGSTSLAMSTSVL